MKGIFFSAFYSYVEHEHGADMLDDVIVAAGLPNGGAYSGVGSYPYQDLQTLVRAYTEATACPASRVLDGFGQHCFTNWVRYVPDFFSGSPHLFDVIENVTMFHETEVLKLYPDAELPKFVTVSRDDDRLVVGYYSNKRLGDLAVGVIKGAAAHLCVRVAVTAEAVEDSSGPYTRLSIDLLGPVGACCQTS